jgi:hypothetical protein
MFVSLLDRVVFRILFVLTLSFFLFTGGFVHADYVHEVSLEPGWSIFSPSQVVESHEFSQNGVESEEGNYTILYLDSSSPSQWSVLSDGEFTPLYGYFIYNKTGTDQVLTIRYKEGLSPSQRILGRTLSPGWNSIGFADPQQSILSGEVVDHMGFTGLLKKLFTNIVPSEGISHVIDFTHGNESVGDISIHSNWNVVTGDDLDLIRDPVEPKGYAVFVTSGSDVEMVGYQQGAEVEVYSSIGFDDSEIFFTLEPRVRNDLVALHSLDICISEYTSYCTEENPCQISDLGVEFQGIKYGDQQSLMITDSQGQCALFDFSDSPILLQPLNTGAHEQIIRIGGKTTFNAEGVVFTITASGDENAEGHAVKEDLISIPDEPISQIFGDATFKRVEAAYYSLNAFYGDAFEDLADAFADPDAPSYTDVPSDHPYFETVEIVHGLDFDHGAFPNQGIYGVNYPISRGDALKIMTLTGDTETNLSPTGITDVTENDSNYEYIVSAYNNCIITDLDITYGKFFPGQVLDEETFGEWLDKTVLVANGTNVCTDDDEEEEVPDEYAQIEVTVSNESPENRSIPTSADNIPFLSLDIKNTEEYPVELTGLTVSHTGHGDYQEIALIKAFVDGKQRGEGVEFQQEFSIFESPEEDLVPAEPEDPTGSEDAPEEETEPEEEQPDPEEAELIESSSIIAPISFENDPIRIESGSTVSLDVLGDINASSAGGEHQLELSEDFRVLFESPQGTTPVVTGDFPLKGGVMTTTNVEVGELGFSFLALSSSGRGALVGQTDVELARILVKAGSVEDVLLQAMELTLFGIGDASVFNARIEMDGETLSSGVVSSDSGKLMFDLTDNNDGGVVIEDEDIKKMRIYGDIDAEPGDTFFLGFDDIDSSVIATGLTFGFGVSLCEGGEGVICTVPHDSEGDRTVTVEGGDIVFDVISRGKSFSPDTDNAELGVLRITNYGEAVNIHSGLTGLLQVYVPTNASNGVGADFLSDIRFVDVDSKTTYMGPVGLSIADDWIPGEDMEMFKAIFSDDTILEMGETLNLTIQADIKSSAPIGTKFVFSIDMSTVEVEGIISGEIADGGTDGQAIDIQPVYGYPYTKEATIENPMASFLAKSLNNNTIVKDARDVVVWRGEVRANKVEDLVIRSLAFDNLGTATDEDVDQYSFFKKEGGVVTPIETAVTPEADGSVIFPNLDEYDTSGMLVPAGDSIEIFVTADASSNPTSGRTLELSLDVNEIDAEDEDGNDALVTNSDGILSSATFTFQGKGSLEVTLDNNTPESTIIIAGTTDVPVGVFEFGSTDEDIEVEELTVLISGVDTGYLYGDTVDDVRSIDAVSLFYYDDGTAVKKTNGQAATVPNIDASTGKVLFQDLDLIIEDGDELLVEVRVDLNEMDDNDSDATSRSGMAFHVALDLSEDDSEVRGVDSGDTLGDDDIAIDDEVNDLTNDGEVLYVMNNKVIAELASGQPTSTLVTRYDADLLKFTLNSSGDNSDTPYLQRVVARITGTNGACIGYDGNCFEDLPDVDGGYVSLYNDDNLLIARADLSNSARVYGSDDNFLVDLLVGDTSGDGVIDQSFTEDEIDGGSETYIIKADTYTTGADTAITTTIFINGDGFGGTEGITWKDGGSDGTDGVLVNWIDLGESDTTTSRIEWTIDNY